MFAKNFQLACGYPQCLGFDPEMFWKCWDQTWDHDGIMFRKVRKRVENPKNLTPIWSVWYIGDSTKPIKGDPS